ncbi:ribosome maturation factor RimP [Clostridium oryzae]|uniref:Ribosome maturation factor RimP n=1 Tax=Clostridium oryzae TaxID=1450648 RepID=A0A1V4IQP6_9CLOT|nr:ribosome maturation factor RimP [Clostridium oryzae]OPJ61807.1 ribosome maturation factor RimP [Clostridium oryzae]
MKNEKELKKINELIKPIVDNLGYELYYIEFVKEDGENYLRVYIDNNDGISLDDCAKVSRPISDMLDVEDPIEESYYLEVSSPGMFRTLYTEEHMKKYTGYPVVVRLKPEAQGRKKISGILDGFDETDIYIKEENSIIKIDRKKIRKISLEGSLKEEITNE